MKVKEENYIDITDKWLNKNHKFSFVKDLEYFEHNNKKYYVDGKRVVLDYSKKEKEVAKFLVKSFGGVIYMVPRVNLPKGIKTPDYIWNDEKWDLKEVYGNKKNTIDTMIKKQRMQSSNFIFCFKNMTKNQHRKVEDIFSNPHRDWIKKIIIINNDKIYKYYIKK